MLKGERPSVRVQGPATRLLIAIIAFAPLVTAQPSTFTGQFAAFSPPTTMSFDQVRGEWINYEAPLTKGILVTADGNFVVTVHEADQRITVRDATTLVLRNEIVVGHGPVALAERSSLIMQTPVGQVGNPGVIAGGGTVSREIWVVLRNQAGVAVIAASDPNPANWRVRDLLRRPINSGSVGAGSSAYPADIAFSADMMKAYVSSSQTDELCVFDAAAKTWLSNIRLSSVHNGVDVAMNEPRSMVRANGKIYVCSHQSGNQSMVPPGPVFGVPGFLVDLNMFPGFSLPDFDIMEVDTATDTVTNVQSGVGSSLFGIAAHPSTGELIVANLAHRNGELIGEGSFPGGRVAEHRLTYLTPGGGPQTYNHVTTTDLTGPNQGHVSEPSDVAVGADGRVYVGGYTSANVGVFDSAGAFLGLIPCGIGPRGLAVRGGELYVLCRGAGEIWCFDVSAGAIPQTPVATSGIGAFDPTWDTVAEGRRVWLDASHSGDGTSSCNTCHHDLRDDGLAWDLSAFHDLGDGFTFQNPPDFWRDQKLIMVTQDLRSIEETAPYHWRGEQKDLEDFNPAFVNLLKGTEHSASDFANLKAFVFSARYGANPHQQVNRNFSPQAQSGLNIFQTVNSDGNMSGTVVRTCEDCHSLPLGTDNSMTDPFVLTGTQVHGQLLKALVTTQMRGMWDKTSENARVTENPNATLQLDSPITGFGFNHQGSDLGADGFVNRNFGLINQAQKDDVNAFQKEFDSGLAPATMFSEMLNQATLATQHIGGYAINQATSGNCDLIGIGRLRRQGVWNDVELLFDRVNQNFTFSDSNQNPVTWTNLQNLASNGNANVLFLGVPVHSGERLAHDRDRDGVKNRDEIALGTDPNAADSDGDLIWDGVDPNPTVPDTTLPILPAPVVSNVTIHYRTTNVIKLTYETDVPSITHVEFGKTTAYGSTYGDELGLPLSSNRWKRHHTAFLRLLEDGQTYHFRIVTKGQITALGGTADQTTSAPADHFAPNLRIRDLDVQTSTVGGITTVTATVVIEDNLGQPYQGADINGLWTFFRDLGAGPDPLIQLFGDGTTDATGTATIVISGGGVIPGDEMDFTIPMLRGSVGTQNTEPGVVDGASPQGSELPFHWPENAKSSVRITLL